PGGGDHRHGVLCGVASQGQGATACPPAAGSAKRGLMDVASILTYVIAVVFTLFFFSIPILIVVYIVGMQRRAGRLLDQWAARNGYRILEIERRRYRKGPFFFTSSNNQVVYRVTVQDAYGTTHRGWVRCGGYRLGSWSDEVAVQWDG